MAETISAKRKEKNLSQSALAEITGINRSMIGRAENKEFMPSVEQLQTLGEVLGFEVTDLFVEEAAAKAEPSGSLYLLIRNIILQ